MVARWLLHSLIVIVGTLVPSVTMAQPDPPPVEPVTLQTGEFVSGGVGRLLTGAEAAVYIIDLPNDPNLLAVSYVNTDDLLRVWRWSFGREGGGGGSDELLDNVVVVQAVAADEVRGFRFDLLSPTSIAGGQFTVGVAGFDLDTLTVAAYGETLSGRLDRSAPVAAFRFSGVSGDIIDLVGAGSLYSEIIPLPAYNGYRAEVEPLRLDELQPAPPHRYALRADGDYVLLLWMGDEAEPVPFDIRLDEIAEAPDNPTRYVRLTQAQRRETILFANVEPPVCLDTRLVRADDVQIVGRQGDTPLFELSASAVNHLQSALRIPGGALELTVETSALLPGLLDFTSANGVSWPAQPPASEFLITVTPCE